jgi:membrane complex biogenesis BtpA family protein
MADNVKSISLESLFGVRKPIIGMIHVLPLPGSPRGRNCDLEAVYRRAVEEARIIEQGGIDGLLLENAGDIPFLKPELIGYETIGAMSVIGDRIRQVTALPFGFNIVANAARASFACAKCSGASFIRVNQWANAYVANEGVIEGAAPTALRYRNQIEAEAVMVFADVNVKHGSHAIVADRAVPEQARDVAFFGADVLIATGSRTGDPATIKDVEDVRAGTDRPVLVGSGLNPENAVELLRVADGAIVGSSFRTTGDMWGPLDPSRIAAVMDSAQSIR